jgi:hypothetical protein
MNPNGSIQAIFGACCTQDVAAIGIHDLPAMPARTAHPPFATLLALPLGVLPFRVAQVVWLVIGTLAIAGGWYLGRVHPWDYAATGLIWMYALSLGILEPFLFLLLAAALLVYPRRPLLAGVLIGLAAAIKVYPAMLLVGLLIAGRWRVVLAGVLAGGAATLLGDVVVGQGALVSWLAYTPHNTAFYINANWQKSPVYLLRQVVPGLPPLPGAVLVATCLILPLLPRLRRSSDPLRPMLPVMLLSSPLLWLTYAGLLAVGPLRLFERICLGILGISGMMLHLRPWRYLGWADPASFRPIDWLNLLLLLVPLFTLWLAWVRAPVEQDTREPLHE